MNTQNQSGMNIDVVGSLLMFSQHALNIHFMVSLMNLKMMLLTGSALKLVFETSSYEVDLSGMSQEGQREMLSECLSKWAFWQDMKNPGFGAQPVMQGPLNRFVHPNHQPAYMSPNMTNQHSHQAGQLQPGVYPTPEQFTAHQGGALHGMWSGQLPRSIHKPPENVSPNRPFTMGDRAHNQFQGTDTIRSTNALTDRWVGSGKDISDSEFENFCRSMNSLTESFEYRVMSDEAKGMSLADLAKYRVWLFSDIAPPTYLTSSLSADAALACMLYLTDEMEQRYPLVTGDLRKISYTLVVSEDVDLLQKLAAFTPKEVKAAFPEAVDFFKQI